MIACRFGFDPLFCNDAICGERNNNGGTSGPSGGIVVVKTVGNGSRNFATISAWENARQGELTTRRILEVTPGQSSFSPGEKVTGTSGCSGTYVAENESLTNAMTMSLDDYTGGCVTGDLLTGTITGATATYGRIIAVGVIERAVLYGDSTFVENVVIEGSTTDIEHYMHITVDPSSRHSGVASTGVVLDPSISGHAIKIVDNFTVVEWIEITDWTDDNELQSSHDAIEVSGDGVLIQNVLIHDDGHGTDLNSDANGITVAWDNISVVVRNSIIYNIARSGILLHEAANSQLTVENCTVVRCTQADNQPLNYPCVGASNFPVNAASLVTIRNTIAMDSNGVDFRIGDFASWGTVENNLSSDDTAPGTGSWLNQVTTAQFSSIVVGNEDLHIVVTSNAVGNGLNLAEKFTKDIDDDVRPLMPAAWDIGADEIP